MNSKVAAQAATELTTRALPDDTGEGTVNSIMTRVPQHEPWPHHENLDPLSFVSTATDRDTGKTIATPKAWKSYSTLNDTFDKLKPPNNKDDQS
jgi:hypothetical protein